MRQVSLPAKIFDHGGLSVALPFIGLEPKIHRFVRHLGVIGRKRKPGLVPRRIATREIADRELRQHTGFGCRHAGQDSVFGSEDHRAAQRNPGENLSKTGRLDERAIEKSLGALRRMKQIAEGFQTSQLKTIATCAVREAANGEEFCRRAQEELGLEIEADEGLEMLFDHPTITALATVVRERRGG